MATEQTQLHKQEIETKTPEDVKAKLFASFSVDSAPHHNALRQLELQCGTQLIRGFSASGLATYIQLPGLDMCFDMGECPMSAVPLNHIFLSHAHGDHARCLLRHRALRGLMGLPGDATYYVPAHLAEPLRQLALAEARFEGVSDDEYVPPNVVALECWTPEHMPAIDPSPKGADDTTTAAPADTSSHVIDANTATREAMLTDLRRDAVPLARRPRLHVRAFAVEHTVPAAGFTIWERRSKLLPELVGLDAKTIGALKKGGQSVTFDIEVPLVTFIGDCTARAVASNSHIWASQIVFLETTYVGGPEGERHMAAQRGHTHLDELVAILQTLTPGKGPQGCGCEWLVLKHFSLKHSPTEVADQVALCVPKQWLPHVRLLIA